MTSTDHDAPWGWAFDEGYEFAHKELGHYPVFAYLARNGDAIEARVRACLSEGKSLADSNHPGASLAISVTGIELIIRYFLLRPLLEGAFLSGELARTLVKRILSERPGDRDRSLLPAILRAWKDDITNIQLPDGRQLWSDVARLVQARHRYVHQGSDVSIQDARLAQACADGMIEQIVFPIAQRLGLTPRQTGRWNIVAGDLSHISDPELRRKTQELNPPKVWDAENPFDT